MHGVETTAQALGAAAAWLLTPEAAAVGRWTLAVTFIWSAVVKLRTPRLAAVALMNFRLTSEVRPSLGLALGLLELALAVGLAAGTAFAAATAAAVLWTFGVALLRAYVGGNPMPCYCFGDDEEPIGRATIVRTSLLASLATAIALTQAPRPGIVGDGVALVIATALVATGALLRVLQRLPALTVHDHGTLQRLGS